MNHLDDDTLLQLTLEILDEPEAREAEAHLASCAECRERRSRVQQHIAVIAGIRLDSPLSVSRPPVRSNRSRSLWRVAALILVGFLAGWISSQWTNHRPVRVIPARFHIVAPADSLGRYSAGDAMSFSRG
jgi:hypothetical protein